MISESNKKGKRGARKISVSLLIISSPLPDDFECIFKDLRADGFLETMAVKVSHDYFEGIVPFLRV